jgi:hypothetical protein
MNLAFLRIAALSLSLAAGASFAADTAPVNDKFTPARTKIAEKNWTAAIDELKKVNDPASAEWNNLMGYSLRKADPGQRRRGREVLQRGAAHRAAPSRRARVLGRALPHDRQPGEGRGAPGRARQGVLPAVRGVQRPQEGVARYKAAGNKYVAQ